VTPSCTPDSHMGRGRHDTIHSGFHEMSPSRCAMSNMFRPRDVAGQRVIGAPLRTSSMTSNLSPSRGPPSSGGRGRSGTPGGQ
jgi:hypothetical protein